MKKLDFMIVGAQKSGTTALAEFLGEHKSIAISEPKEAHLFDAETVDHSIERIQSQYELAFTDRDSDSLLRGEATPIYMYLPGIARQLSDYNPQLKIIVILRNPVERAYSHYCMERKRGNEHLPFWLALLLEKHRLKKDSLPRSKSSAHRRWSYIDRGCYSRQLEEIFKSFPSGQVLVVSNQGLKYDHGAMLNQVFDFLGVEQQRIPARDVFSQLTNVCEVPFSRLLLRVIYRRELIRLQKLVDFSVAAWR
jgi:hypothetical protein